MNKRRWIIGAAAVLLSILAFKGIGAYRWSRLSAEEKAGTMTERLAHRLGLSDEQKNQVYNLNLDKVRAFDAARQAGKPTRADWKNLREEWRKGLQEVLTPAQREKLGKC
jgi:Spy/CpxP family protein refolding chaperone